ncbi:uncharacterized protein METZ01_LOCUS515573, partial [marine metagenome]
MHKQIQRRDTDTAQPIGCPTQRQSISRSVILSKEIQNALIKLFWLLHNET